MIWLDRIDCQGYEDSVQHCYYKSYNRNGCSGHERDLAIQCGELQVSCEFIFRFFPRIKQENILKIVSILICTNTLPVLFGPLG